MTHRWVGDLSCKSIIYLSWFTSEIMVKLAPYNIYRPTGIFYWLFFCGSFCFLNLISVMLSCLFLAITCWERVTSWLSLRDIFFRCCHFPVWFHGSFVAFNCIGSWFLHSSIPCAKYSLLICYNDGNWWLHVRVLQEHGGLPSVCTVRKK